ncbi:MAG: hypothetical protein OXP09_12180 [Gammaproteobacteria bacterium]|nr:hypothetical protein [Gammaproteobacteria bacterium]
MQHQHEGDEPTRKQSLALPSNCPNGPDHLKARSDQNGDSTRRDHVLSFKRVWKGLRAQGWQPVNQLTNLVVFDTAFNNKAPRIRADRAEETLPNQIRGGSGAATNVPCMLQELSRYPVALTRPPVLSVLAIGTEMDLGVPYGREFEMVDEAHSGDWERENLQFSAH